MIDNRKVSPFTIYKSNVCILMINERKKVTPEINKHLFGQESKLLACVVDSRLNNAKLPKKIIVGK